jgi:hypothetical protein
VQQSKGYEQQIKRYHFLLKKEEPISFQRIWHKNYPNGIPDTYREETVKVFVVTKPYELLTKDDVIDFCKERLASYTPCLQSVVGKILQRGAYEDRGKEKKRHSLTNSQVS